MSIRGRKCDFVLTFAFRASFCASLLPTVSLLIPIAAAQKFRIPRIADIFVQASEPRSWINDRADFFQRCDITSRGLFCAGAREVPCSASRRSKSIEECDFWRFRVVKMRFFCSEHRKFMKMDRGKAGNPPNRPSRIRWRRNFGNPFVSSGLRSSKVAYFDVK